MSKSFHHERKHLFGSTLTISTLLVLLTATTMPSRAGFRIWTNEKGKTIEGEYVTRFGDKVTIHDQQGKFIKIDLAKLCKDDQLYVQLQNPPELDFKIKVIKRKPVRSTTGDCNITNEETSNGWCGGHEATSSQKYSCSVSTEKLNSYPYQHSFLLNLYWIARVYNVQEKKWNVVLSRHEKQTFGLSDRDKWSWDSSGTNYRSKETFTHIRNMNYDKKIGQGLGNMPIHSTRKIEYSTQHVGVLAVVTDNRSEMLALDYDNYKLKKMANQIMKAGLNDCLAFDD